VASYTFARAVWYNVSMITVSIAEAERDLAAYVDIAASGETVLLTRAARPVAELRPIGEANCEGSGLRPYGLAADEFRVPADFDAPLPEHILEEFEGGRAE